MNIDIAIAAAVLSLYHILENIVYDCYSRLPGPQLK